MCVCTVQKPVLKDYLMTLPEDNWRVREAVVSNLQVQRLDSLTLRGPQAFISQALPLTGLSQPRLQRVVFPGRVGVGKLSCRALA